MSLDISITIKKEVEVFDGNATHNLIKMWEKAGIYDDLYNSGGKKSKEILPNLLKGLSKMLKNAKGYKKLNPKNGWGNYEGAILFLKDVISACEKNPNGKINISK
jgi:hypothetical protein